MVLLGVMVPQDPISKRAEEERRMVRVRELDDTPPVMLLFVMNVCLGKIGCH